MDLPGECSLICSVAADESGHYMYIGSGSDDENGFSERSSYTIDFWSGDIDQLFSSGAFRDEFHTSIADVVLTLVWCRLTLQTEVSFMTDILCYYQDLISVHSFTSAKSITLFGPPLLL